MDSIVISVLGKPIDISTCFCYKAIEACADVNTRFHLQRSYELKWQPWPMAWRCPHVKIKFFPGVATYIFLKAATPEASGQQRHSAKQGINLLCILEFV